MKKNPILAIVVPCYNEEEVLPETVKRLVAVLNSLQRENLVSNESFICFIDDGSKDQTWKLITEYHEKNPAIKGIKLARNAGHQKALLSGLLTVRNKADLTLSIDADLQDDTDVILEFVKRYHEGNEIVYGVRKERQTDTFFKKWTALAFYKLMTVMGVDIIYNHADYRLASSKVLNYLSDYKEVNLFLRGLFPLIGFKTSCVYYDRKERFAGESKYPFFKMLSFALDGITSFSVVPLRLIVFSGIIIFIVSLILSLWALVQWFKGTVVAGWASTVIPIYFIGGIQLISLGVIGEYIGKIYKETKKRPHYVNEIELF